ncbi:uncharacterized protein BX664DRAFT_384525 [Halteromyces radiatus]|uniref:uncharacterized protein n=1 Tax=Halteromyces radiatus TaxID=101107 RepID=UPI00221EA506|nr:uncharacterized protein BX664DRAFT_384525 [Halteromyces radiatus]KAI8093041.1 hypothetical protein BX664DRAFT_384525 [Halteromyces radiatus]
MSGKKKTQKQKMSLSDFLADESSGSWADEMSDLPSAPSVTRDEGGAFGGSGGRFDDLPRGPARNNGGDRFAREDRHEGGFREREGGFREREGGFREREGGFRERERSFPPRAPAVLPTDPPFTAHIANLSFDVTEDDLADFFSNMKIVHLRILRDRESDRSKGYGYIEFEDLDSLKAALELSGESLQNRAVRVNVADPPKERPERPERQDRTNVGSWRREGPVVLPERQERPERSERHGGFRDRHERPERTFVDRRSDTSWSGGAFNKDGNRRRDPPAERPRLNLLPRTINANKSEDKSSSTKASPFGLAKPVDTSKVLERVEDKIQHLKVDDGKKEE